MNESYYLNIFLWKFVIKENMIYIWKNFPREIIKGDNVTESGFNYKEDYEKEFIRRYGWTLLGIVAGMVGGYLYWRYVGCSTGTCPITSSPVNSSIWGAAMGGLLLSSFIPERKEIKKEE